MKTTRPPSSAPLHCPATNVLPDTGIDSKVIVYDDACPLCSLYTKAFVQAGMLRAENRIGFSQLEPDELAGMLDPVRARHEIPLLDRSGGATLYGVDALVFILRQRLPLIGRGMKLPGVAAFIRGLYALISYNRRVIIPSRRVATGVDCTPDVHTGYRLGFIALGLLLFAAALFLLVYVGAGLSATAGVTVLIVVGIAISAHVAVARLAIREIVLEYAGQTAVTLVLFALAAIPAAGVSVAVGEPFVALAGAAVGSGLLLWQHYRRMLHLGVSGWWTLSWGVTLAAGTAIGFAVHNLL